MDENVFHWAESRRILYLNRKRKYGAEHPGTPLLKHNSCDHKPVFTPSSDPISETKRCRNDTSSIEDESVAMSSEETSTLNNYAGSVSVRIDRTLPPFASSSTLHNLTEISSHFLESSTPEASSINEEPEFLSSNGYFYHNNDLGDELPIIKLCTVCTSLNGVTPTADDVKFCECENSVAGAKQGSQKTIDKEFEEYFSMLML